MAVCKKVFWLGAYSATPEVLVFNRVCNPFILLVIDMPDYVSCFLFFFLLFLLLSSFCFKKYFYFDPLSFPAI